MGSSKVSRTKGLLSSSEIIAEIINNLLHQKELRYRQRRATIFLSTE